MTYTAGLLEGSRVGWSTNSELGNVVRVIGAMSAANASTAWPGSNNDAYIWPMLLLKPETFTGAFFYTGTTPGTTNYDIGIYDDTFTRLASIGSTASVNTTAAILPVGGGAFAAAVTLLRGRYFVGMSSASTALTLNAQTVTGWNSTPRLMGFFKMASAHPLPATFVPASVGTTAFVPTIGLLTPIATVL